ncbi:MAG: hypothetical protein U0164_16705 [Gemmatimonadaceae bacterium]
MYSWETLVLLRHLLDQGLGKTAIAEQTGVSRGLIYHLLRTGQLDRDLAAPRPARARPRVPHKLDAYCAIIDARLATYPALSAVRLIRTLPIRQKRDRSACNVLRRQGVLTKVA